MDRWEIKANHKVFLTFVLWADRRLPPPLFLSLPWRHYRATWVFSVDLHLSRFLAEWNVSSSDMSRSLQFSFTQSSHLYLGRPLQLCPSTLPCKRMNGNRWRVQPADVSKVSKTSNFQFLNYVILDVQWDRFDVYVSSVIHPFNVINQ